ncbi:QueT transporter family protein [Lacticaseibacillus jixianensis]|uniref:QueT transporter family protein n=1 Tax=Lacticaseibacillus jixianensis TaxID=2486012 RepID=A0ABW4B823_9LACO|nr:QueT transporter family protein [Lacticaseibacillus jixianensis]
MQTHSRTRTLVINALVAAIYVVLSYFPGVFNLASGAIQFRISEALNHLVAFNRKYLYGVLVGVVLYNALFSPMGWLDVLFGGGQSLLGLGLVALVGPRLAKVWQRQLLTVCSMSLTMFLIWIEIVLTAHMTWFGGASMLTLGELILSELVIMLISWPIMYAIDRAVRFSQRIS